jgi:hypothetical protein
MMNSPVSTWKDNWGGTPNVAPPTSNMGFDLNYGAGWNKGDYLTKLLGAAYPGALNGAFFASSWGQPRSQRETMSIYDMLSPGGARARTQQFGQQAIENATTTGTNQGNQLASLGFGKSAQAGALLDAGNQARTQTSDFYAQNADPLALAQQRLGVANNAGQNASMTNVLQLLGQYDPGIDQQKGSGILGSLLGLAGAAGGLGWSPFGKGGK